MTLGADFLFESPIGAMIRKQHELPAGASVHGGYQYQTAMRQQLAAVAWALRLICLLTLAAISSLPAAADAPLWLDRDAAGERRVHLYFFWTQSCPHCQAARPFVEALPARYPWLQLHSRDLSSEQEAVKAYVAMAASLGQEASSVPAFLFCGRMEVGFDRPEVSGRALEDALQSCHDAGIDAAEGSAAQVLQAPPGVDLPLLGRMTPEQLSLPVFTLVIAGLDAFNPCAFFVLLFLLSLLIHAGSRARMLFIGGVFLFFSGLIYFLFMAAWLNAFRWLGEIALVTTAAGGLAILIALINIKDYFWFRKGISLSISDAAKPGLYQRVRGLLRADSLPALTLGTVALAVAANSYELLCTAGFPMVYTRLLTLSDLAPWQHYAYLLLYNIVYIIPLMIITLVFTYSLGSRKLSESEGRLLKLLSGNMMLGLGIVLLVAPAALNDLRVALLLLVGALGGSWLVHRLMHGRRV
jgi:thiol-disulfide isomerase/thioredoxin